MSLRNHLCVLSGHLASFVLIALMCTTAHAQAPAGGDLAKGEIVEKVVCAESPQQSYALYLPSQYTPEHRWPLLLVLDPGARGKIPVEHFQAAAEKYGWIVAASNNSRNGPIEQPVEAVNAMWRDTHARFSVDDRRVYFAGFSGAARAVITIAGMCNKCAAGLITGGAGFPGGFTPSAATAFAVFTTVGVDDFNFAEVRLFDDALAKAGVDHQVRIFDGRHEWAPADVLVEAVEWMELRAMRTGSRSRDDKIIEDLWQKQMSRAQALENSDQYQAYRTYVAAANAFNSLRDVTRAKERIAALDSSREIKAARRSEEQQVKRQRDLEKQIYTLLGARTGLQSLFADDDRQGSGSSASEDSLGAQPNGTSSGSTDSGSPADSDNRLRALLADIRKASASSSDTSERRVARRVAGGLYIALIERGSNLLEVQKRYAIAARMFALATEVSPERPGGYYLLAMSYAANGDKKKSLHALKTAFEKGFKDLEAVRKNAAFDSIRGEAAYQELVNRVSGPQS